MKRILSISCILLIFLSILTTFPVRSFASSPEGTPMSIRQVEIPEKVSDPTLSKLKSGLEDYSDATATSSSYTYGGKTYYSLGRQLYARMRNLNVARDTSYYMYYLSNTQLDYGDLASDMATCSLNACDEAISVSSLDGDYIRWQRATNPYVQSWTLSKVNGKYLYRILIGQTYYDNSSEESKVGGVINTFVKNLESQNLSDYQRIKKVHDFILDKCTYDTAAAKASSSNDSYNYAYSAYGCLVKGKAVCQGYALAFHRIMKELGYDDRFVSSDPSRGCHAWNIVKLNGKCYFVDATWDDEEDDTYKFFMVNYTNLKSKDSIYREHSLYNALYSESADKYFYKKYKECLSENDYDANDTSLISNAVITLSKKDYVYSGNANTPSISVKSASSAMNSDSDYSYVYSSNVQTGCAKITINGEGSYSGSTSRNFFISPKSVTGLKVIQRGSDYLDLQWNKPEGNVSEYLVEIYKDGSWVKVKRTSNTGALITDLGANKLYSIRVRAYKLYNTRGLYSQESIFYRATKPGKVTLSSVKSESSKTATVKWKKKSCSGYEIRYSTKKDMSSAKSVKVSKDSISKKIKNLSKNKRYYFQVRAYGNKKISGKVYTYYGAWSSKKSIVIK